MLPELSRDEILRYSRNLLIPEVGLDGQRKLKAASVLVVGTGGLGSPVALYLAAAGVGRIGLVDYDVVELSNLQRQVIHGMSGLSTLKVDSACRRMLDLNPTIKIEAISEPLTSQNAHRITESYDLLIDCSDNFPTRYLINDLCVLTGKPDIYGSVFRFDGQVSVFDARYGPCYRCLFPAPPPPGMLLSCAEGGVLGVVPGTIGTLQAGEAIKLILDIGEPLIGKLLLYNTLDLSFDLVRLRKNPDCKICGSDPQVTELVDYEAFCGTPMQDRDSGVIDVDWEITATELADRLRGKNPPRLIDVRELHEQHISNIAGAVLISLGQLARRLSELDSHDEMVVFCRSGIRSRHALELLASAGFCNVKHLKGGINAWVEQVDPGLPIY